MEDERLRPEDFLEAVKQEKKTDGRGKLKIFLGLAPGVGKTYTMLSEAHERQAEGTYVLVGNVETHGREETALLLEGLEVLPRKIMTYRDKQFAELDLDAVLKLHPQLVIIDELAHMNIPGSRHPKRWQDVMEILENGIDVYTTLNVQHIESLNDVVKNITDVAVRETVPDLIIEGASSIRLIDLSPEELLVRLKEGKVYLGEQPQIAALNFFQVDKLTALREIVLRYTAERVDHDLKGLSFQTDRGFTWKPREKFMVAVTSALTSQKLIRTARRLASRINAPWIVLYVDTGRELDDEENKQLLRNLALARNLGAEVLTTNDPDVANGIERVAKQRGVTQIVLGRSPARTFFGIFQPITLVDKLALICKDIDLHVIRKEGLLSTHQGKKLIGKTARNGLPSYFFVALIILILTAANWVALPLVGYKVVGVIYLIGIICMSLFFRKGPILVGALLSGFAWVFFFIPPIGRLLIDSYEDRAILALYFVSAIATGILADRARAHQQMLAKREESAQALYDIVRFIATLPGKTELFKMVKESLEKQIKGSFEIVEKKANGELNFNPESTLLTSEKEKNAAIWAFENEKEAGWSTDSLPASQNLYIPLMGFHEADGLLIYQPVGDRPLTPEQTNFLYTVCQQLATYLERSLTEEKERENEQVKQVEKFYKTILERVSHMFSPSLEIIQRATKDIHVKAKSLDAKLDITGSLKAIQNASEGLLKILGNILAMAQLSEGLIPLNKKQQNMKELVQECCENVRKSNHTHTIEELYDENIPLIAVDFYLIEMVLFNLIYNAIENSPPTTKVLVEVRLAADFLRLSVAGAEIPLSAEDAKLIYEKFFRLPESVAPDIGLGLAIAKTIVEVHDGYLRAELDERSTMKFSLFLPLTP